ncbi:MAG TPA: MBL fold metallo-hydrolase [Methanoregulaceae archaeon]|nr:MBL fold metallo-hydrolase [Methanoregulaceae archaeon]HPD75242.1 MBL fold metallo-hydrolase [Methanoregulaceae archaeon]HRY75107.1 MBL fold metallo-hydrolase [Methanoregulaceae archaeon]
MYFEKIVAEGLSHNSYLIGSQGKAAVIDPRRDCDVYIRHADQADLLITHIFETHRNEDYCIGSRELAEKTGSVICHGANTPFRYGTPVKEGDEFMIGSLRLSIIETPGHTEESISIVLSDPAVADTPYMIFCGDTLFAGDVARTDFYGRERDAEMAAKIYDSIRTKILALGDGIILCPAHGGGSVCGTEIRDYPFTTTGYEKMTNPFLSMGRDRFIRERIRQTPYTPPYFRHMERCNLTGAPILHGVPLPPRLPVARVQELQSEGGQILDLRSPPSFAAAHIPQSLAVWRTGISAFTGWFFDYERPIVVIDDFNTDLDPVIRQLMRLGYDNVAGFLAGGFSSWYRSALETASFATCTVQDLHERLRTETPFILDVRDIRNFSTTGHLPGAYHAYVGELPQHISEIPRDRPIVVTCDAGFKSSLAASYLAANGYTQITNLLGGMRAWVLAGYPLLHSGDRTPAEEEIPALERSRILRG